MRSLIVSVFLLQACAVDVEEADPGLGPDGPAAVDDVVDAEAVASEVTVERRCATTMELDEIEEIEAYHADLLGPDFDARPWTGVLGFSATVDVYVHVITNGARGNVSTSQIDRQIDVLNAAYATAGFAFNLVQIDTVNNASWYSNCHAGSEYAMKSAMRLGGPDDLNLYLCAPWDDTLGVGAFPWDYGWYPVYDGVIVHSGTLPGGNFFPVNQGDTAVHEIGHWLGLYHTFEGGCGRTGDRVSDTPAERSPAMGCPRNRDTCGGGGKDPVTNYMDYTDDACMDRFSAGQVNRMQSMWQTWR